MRQKGITLIEIIVTTGIISIIGLLLLVIVVNSTGIFYKESAKLSQGLNSNDTMTQMRESLKQSNGVVVSYTLGSVIYTSSSTELVFQVPSIDPSNNIIASTYDYFVLFSSQNQLRFKIFPNPLSARKPQDQIFSTNLDSLKFQYFNLANPPVEVTPASALKVRITLALKQKSGANYETKIATSEAVLRND